MSMKTLLLLVLFTGLSIRFVSAQMITIEEAQAKAKPIIQPLSGTTSSNKRRTLIWPMPIKPTCRKVH